MSRSAVKIIQVLQIKGTSTEEVISFALQNFELQKYLLIYKKLRLPNRPWICNLGRHLFNYVRNSHNNRSKIQGMNRKRIEEKEKHIVIQKLFTVNVLPKFEDEFKASKSGSSKKFLIVQFSDIRKIISFNQAQREKRPKLEESKEIE